MSPHAFDTQLRAVAGRGAADARRSSRCVPAPADVEDAAKLYGAEPARRDDPRCR